MTVFGQILELDDGDEDHSFSSSMVREYLNQAEVTFKNMDDSLCVLDLS